MTDAGVTGTQEGATREQLRQVVFLIARLGLDRLHHGDCVGVDAQVHELVRDLEPGAWVVGHPPEDPNRRAFTDCDEWRDPLPFLERNRAVVDESAYVIGVPRGYVEERRSGTWSTIRYARRVQRPLAVVFPAGETLMRNLPIRLATP